MSSSDNNNNSKTVRHALTSSAPMYITIGPQCCGKSSYLEKIDNLVDISLDDQPDVYVPVPTKAWLDVAASNDAGDSSDLLEEVYQGKTLKERIQSDDNLELRLILQRWNDELTPQEFAEKILECYQQRERPKSVATLLIQTVEMTIKEQKAKREDNTGLPETALVFCLESLFRPHPETNQSAIQRGLALLRTTPRHLPVAWGNTNSKVKDFQQALEVACQCRRPVYFIIAGEPFSSSSNSNNNKQQQEEDDDIPVPWVELKALLIRNLNRLQKTGKYIPAFAVADCSDRIEQLIADAKTMKDKAVTSSMEQSLVSMASNDPKQQRNNRHQRGKPFTFVLAQHNLIQKQFPKEYQDGPRRRPSSPRAYSLDARRPGGGRVSSSSQRFSAPRRNQSDDYNERRRGQPWRGQGRSQQQRPYERHNDDYDNPRRPQQRNGGYRDYGDRRQPDDWHGDQYGNGNYPRHRNKYQQERSSSGDRKYNDCDDNRGKLSDRATRPQRGDVSNQQSQQRRPPAGQGSPEKKSRSS